MALVVYLHFPEMGVGLVFLVGDIPDVMEALNRKQVFPLEDNFSGVVGLQSRFPRGEESLVWEVREGLHTLVSFAVVHAGLVGETQNLVDLHPGNLVKQTDARLMIDLELVEVNCFRVDQRRLDLAAGWVVAECDPVKSHWWLALTVPHTHYNKAHRVILYYGNFCR